jgi:hypothetical protein
MFAPVARARVYDRFAILRCSTYSNLGFSPNPKRVFHFEGWDIETCGAAPHSDGVISRAIVGRFAI